MAKFVVDIWLIVICFTLVAGIVFRLLSRSLPPIHMYKVAPQAASRLVGEFIASSYDGRFGYPSGLFRIERADEREIMAREIVAQGTRFTHILAGLYRLVLGWGTAFGCCIGSLVALSLAVVLTPVLLYAALAETLLQYLLRSRIVAVLEGAGDGTKVTFKLRGPAAMLVGSYLERAFHAPVLPTRIAALAGVVLPSARTIAPPAN